MKTIQFPEYGSAAVLTVNETKPPVLKAGQVLVKNKAASVNAIDWKVRAGYLAKMMPLTFPVTIGGDFAGVVSEVENATSPFKVGDEVYGQAIVLNGGSGSMATMVVSNSGNMALKPKSVDFAKAAALPLAGSSAIQALEAPMNLHKGQEILIHGAAGGIGHLAVQYAKALGAYVIATASAKDVAFVKSLGADEIIDYKTQKFEELVKNIDAVFDTVGGDTTDKSFTVLKKGGIIVSMAGQPKPELAMQYGVTAVGQMTVTDTARLVKLAQLVDAGKITVHVDKVFPLEKTKDAFEYQETMHPQGKVVVTV
jgi:alcohol dehydrogenase